MQFNSNGSNLDLYSEARTWCGISTSDTTKLPLGTFTRGANFGLDRVVSLIMRSDRRWKWDDANNTTDLPIGTKDLVSGQADYSFATTHLQVLDVKIKDSGGNRVNLEKAEGSDLAELQVKYQTSGTPRAYVVHGGSIFLSPAPDYSSTDGLIVYYQRGASLFVTTDTTKEPGFASPFHRLIALYPARDYCSVNNMPQRLAAINSEIARMEAELIEHYSGRAGDAPANMSFESEDYGQDTDG